MKLLNKSERAISIAGVLLVPTEEKDVEDETILQHPRMQELLKLKDIEIVKEEVE